VTDPGAERGMARRRDNALPFRKPFRAAVRNRRARKGGITPIMVTLPLAAFTAVFLFGAPIADSTTLPVPQRGASDGESARFTRCYGPVRVNCVVDGDTFWYGGEKIRIADINTPEVSKPDCPRELALGERATDRLLALLNEGAFTLAPNADGADRDRYGRLLRTVTRDGASVGDVLVSEGLAEEWTGRRRYWC
jgi:endonuclease YncB( thermonuclease family)